MPEIAAVVQQDEVLGIQHHLILFVPELLVAERSNCHQVFGPGRAQAAAQVKGAGIKSHGVLGRQEVVIVDTANHGGLICGEHFAVCLIPQGDARGIRAGILQSLAFHGHLVHGPSVLRSVHDVHDIVLGIVGSRGEACVHRSAASPGRIRFQIPLEEHGIAVLVLQDAVQSGVDRFHRHHAGSIHRRIQNRGRRDDALTNLQAGHDAAGVHRCNRLIGGGPGHIPVGSRPGQNGSRQLGFVAPQNAEARVRQIHSGHLVGGLRPAAAGRLQGDAQSRDFVLEVLQGHHFTGGRVDFIQLCIDELEESVEVKVVEGVPIQLAVIGI